MEGSGRRDENAADNDGLRMVATKVVQRWPEFPRGLPRSRYLPTVRGETGFPTSAIAHLRFFAHPKLGFRAPSGQSVLGRNVSNSVFYRNLCALSAVQIEFLRTTAAGESNGRITSGCTLERSSICSSLAAAAHTIASGLGLPRERSSSPEFATRQLVPETEQACRQTDKRHRIPSMRESGTDGNLPVGLPSSSIRTATARTSASMNTTRSNPASVAAISGKM